MQLLVNEHKKEIEQLDNKIQACNSTIASSDASSSLADKEKELNIGLEKFSRDIITKKEWKLARDLKAFQTKKAYVWPSPSQSYQPRANRRNKYRKYSPKNGNNSRGEGESDQAVSDSSSVTSASSINSSAPPRYVTQARKRLKGADQESHLEKRHGNTTTHTGEVYTEVMGPTSTPNAPSTSTTTSSIPFLGTSNTPRPGTMQAHFPQK